MTIQPIETRYAGCRFRSRLEARWAVFFDALSIRWEYEPQGYVLDGRPYLPDFQLFLPDGPSVFAEVKNGGVDDHEGEHVDLCRALANEANCKVLLLAGAPAHRLYHQFTPGLQSDSFQAAFFCDYGTKLVTADEYWFQRAAPNPETGALEFQHDGRGLRKSFGQGLVDAVAAARSARFEHGESGAQSPARSVRRATIEDLSALAERARTSPSESSVPEEEKTPELALVALLLKDPSAIPMAADLVESGDFGLLQAAFLYQVILVMDQLAMQIDPLTAWAMLAECGVKAGSHLHGLLKLVSELDLKFMRSPDDPTGAVFALRWMLEIVAERKALRGERLAPKAQAFLSENAMTLEAWEARKAKKSKRARFEHGESG